jgi:hypothetical protein
VKFFVDLAERVVATGAFAFLSAFTVTDLSTTHAAALAGAAASLSVVKGLLAAFLNSAESASLVK